MTLPNGWIVQVTGERARALDERGEVRWEVALPPEGGPVAPPAAARNSTVYVRARRSLLAVGHEGTLRWRVPLEVAPHEAAPTALPDSGVVVAASATRLEAYTPEGERRWEASVPSGHLTGAPRLGRGQLLVPTSTGVYALALDGTVAWRTP